MADAARGAGDQRDRTGSGSGCHARKLRAYRSGENRPGDGAIFAIVGGKSGPREGYLWQYRLTDAGNGTVTATRVRAFGAYRGKKATEAIAVDQPLGFVYYSDAT